MTSTKTSGSARLLHLHTLSFQAARSDKAKIDASPNRSHAFCCQTNN